MVAGRDDVSRSCGRWILERVSRNALGSVHAEAAVPLSREEDRVIETTSTSRQSHGRFRSEFDLDDPEQSMPIIIVSN